MEFQKFCERGFATRNRPKRPCRGGWRMKWCSNGAKKTPKSHSQVGVAGKNGPLLPQVLGLATVCRTPQNRRICKKSLFLGLLPILEFAQMYSLFSLSVLSSLLFPLLSSSLFSSLFSVFSKEKRKKREQREENREERGEKREEQTEDRRKKRKERREDREKGEERKEKGLDEKKSPRSMKPKGLAPNRRMKKAGGRR